MIPKRTAEPNLITRPPAEIWKSFSFGGTHVLLHVPTSTVIEANAALCDHVDGRNLSSAAETQLAAWDLAFPKRPAKPAPKISIRTISLNVAQSCNLRCTYCFAGDGDYGKTSLMKAETAIRAVEYFAAGQEALQIAFFGGEPLLNLPLIYKVVDFCEAYEGCRFSFAVTTNGTLLEPSVLEYFKEKNFSVTVSYDGPGLQAKQRLSVGKRGNSQELVERKLACLKEHLDELKSFKLRGTISKSNLSLAEDAIAQTLTSQNYRFAVGRHATAAKDLAFSQEDIDELGQIIGRIVTRHLEEKNYEALLKLEPLSTHIKWIHRGKVGRNYCSAGISYVSVSTSGNFYLCHRFTEDESGRVGSLAEGLDLEALSGYADHRRVAKKPCSTCWMREWCGGGCFHENKTASGSATEPDPTFCQLQDLELTQAMRVYTAILANAPSLLGP